MFYCVLDLESWLECVLKSFPQCLAIEICSVVTKNAYHRHKGVSIGWVNSFWLSKLLFWLSKMRFCENWSLWAKVGGQAKRGRWSERRQRRPGVPTHLRSQRPVLTKSHFTQPRKQFTQPKRIYSANGNPFILIIIFIKIFSEGRRQDFLMDHKVKLTWK